MLDSTYTHCKFLDLYFSSAVFSGGTGGARAPPEFRGSQKGQSLISAYQSLAITTNTPGFEKLNTALKNCSNFRLLQIVNQAYYDCSAVFCFSNPGVFAVIAKL